MRPVLFGLAFAACRADPPPAPTGDTGAATSDPETTPPTPPSATVTVDAPGAAEPHEALFLWVSDVDGSLVRTVEVADVPVVVADVPIGGSVTFGIVQGGRYYLQTIGDVQDGDVLRPFSSWGGPANGTVQITVPSVPDGADPLIDAFGPCVGWGGFAVPFDGVGATTESCYPAGAPASAWIAARPGFALPFAVAWLADVSPTGGDLTFAFPADGWVSDYGRAAVSYTHSGDAQTMEVRAWSTRGSLVTSGSVAADADTTDGESLVATIPADSAFHDHLIAGVRAGAYPHQSTVYVSTASVADRGETAETRVDPSEVPPPVTLALDPVARTSDLGLPEGWSCAGRPANVARLAVSVAWYESSVSWTLAAPYAPDLVFPAAPAEIEALLAKGVYRTSSAEVASVDGGFDSLRESTLLDADWVDVLAARPPGGALCAARSDPAL